MIKPTAALSLLIPFVFAIQLTPWARADDNPLSQQNQLSAWQSFVEDVEDFFGFGSRVTSWDEISAWKAVGNRFAAGYGDDGSILALYDLSYPDLVSPVTLGVVGGANGRADALVNAWRNAKKNEPSLPADIRSAIDAMGDLPERVLRAGVIPRDWWKGLPWLSRSMGASEPAEFSLADLDLGQLGIGADFISDFREMLRVILYGADADASTASGAASGALAAASDTEVLDSIRFVRQAEGEYRIVFQVPASIAAKGGPTRPRKLLDLQGTKNGMLDNIKIQGLVIGLGELASLIPVPVVSALVNTAISRLERYFTMTQTEHLEMVRELMTETDESSHADPVLSQLGEDDHDGLISAFIWERVTPVDFWDWLFTTPLSSWNKQQSEDAQCSAQSRQWLRDSGAELADLNSRFVLATAPASQESAPRRGLYVDADVCASGDTPPEVSIDYSDPLAIAVDRLTLEAQGIGVEFATNMIPTFGFAVMAAYNFLVQDPVDNDQYWEARLMQHLELRNDASVWSRELSILQGQRVNPLEIDRERMNQLISARRRMIGL